MEKLGTVNEALLRLEEAGFEREHLRDLLECNAGRQGPLVAERVYPDGEGKLRLEWQFIVDEGRVTLERCRADLLTVPLSHAVVGGINTEWLESRMRSIDWTLAADEIFLTMIPSYGDLVDDVYVDIDRLLQSDNLLAEELGMRLAVKYWSWEPPVWGSRWLTEQQQAFPGFTELRNAAVFTWFAGRIA